MPTTTIKAVLAAIAYGATRQMDGIAGFSIMNAMLSSRSPERIARSPAMLATRLVPGKQSRHPKSASHATAGTMHTAERSDKRAKRATQLIVFAFSVFKDECE